MSYHPRIETSEIASFLTTRSRNSELWFANNPSLESASLAYAAKYSLRYGVKLYALAIEGNHIQGPAQFPNCNRASFMRDLNSSIARAVPRLTPDYPGGRFWGRRYSSEFLPDAEDIEDRFFYTVLQPVQDGLVKKISEYPGYNCFNDAVSGIARKHKVVRWAEYHAAKRYNPQVRKADYTDTYVLKYERLPGYEDLSQVEYKKMMQTKLEERRRKIVASRLEKGLGFLGPEKLKEVLTGAKPRSTKTSTSSSYRPRVLSVCPKRREQTYSWYFQIYDEYKEASQRFRLGEFDVEFPSGTYRPPQVVQEISMMT